MCNESIGLFPCMDGTCFLEEHRCDGVAQCTDHLDEMGCDNNEDFNKYTSPLQRYKHSPRHFEEDASWLWKGHFTKLVIRFQLLFHYILEIMSRLSSKLCYRFYF